MGIKCCLNVKFNFIYRQTVHFQSKLSKRKKELTRVQVDLCFISDSIVVVLQLLKFMVFISLLFCKKRPTKLKQQSKQAKVQPGYKLFGVLNSLLGKILAFLVEKFHCNSYLDWKEKAIIIIWKLAKITFLKVNLNRQTVVLRSTWYF